MNRVNRISCAFTQYKLKLSIYYNFLLVYVRGIRHLGVRDWITYIYDINIWSIVDYQHSSNWIHTLISFKNNKNYAPEEVEYAHVADWLITAAHLSMRNFKKRDDYRSKFTDRDKRFLKYYCNATPIRLQLFCTLLPRNLIGKHI